MAGTFRLVLVATGGMWLSNNNGSSDQMFMVIAAGMVCYGVLTALAVWKTNWARLVRSSKRWAHAAPGRCALSRLDFENGTTLTHLQTLDVL
jgi:hypothetical protein